MPKSLGGLFAFVLASVIATLVGVYIINRVGVLSRVAYGNKQAA